MSYEHERKELSKLEDSIQMCPTKQELSQRHIQCNRCGDCCRAFTLPWSPDRLKENHLAAQRGDSQYSYHDDSGVKRTDYVNAMMAVWAWALTSRGAPEAILAQRKENTFGRHWYCCSYYKELNGKATCMIHDNRPRVCSGYAPNWQGGYIRDGDQIIYEKCSYRKEWNANELDSQSLEEKLLRDAERGEMNPDEFNVSELLRGAKEVKEDFEDLPLQEKWEEG